MKDSIENLMFLIVHELTHMSEKEMIDNLNGIHTEFIITLSKLYELKQRIENGK